MSKKSNKIKGQLAENRAQKTINSGSLWFDKGDLKVGDYLIDSKTTDKKSFNITVKMLEKIYQEAFDRNKFPVLYITIEQPEYRFVLQMEVKKEAK